MTAIALIRNIEEQYNESIFEEHPLYLQTYLLASSLFAALEAIKSEAHLLNADETKELRSRLRTLYLGQQERIHQAALTARLATYVVAWLTGEHLKERFTDLDKMFVQRAAPLSPEQKHSYLEPVFDPTLFPKEFQWGAGTCEYQLSGAENCSHNQWVEWEAPERQTGTATDHWNRSIEDVQLLKALNINSYRFSVEWSEIEPSPGAYNQEAIAHYQSLCKELKANGITPCVTLHHFTHPLWFEELGAFEKEENIAHIVRFTEKMYDALGEDVEMWFTINEPNVYASQGYHSGFIGSFPPKGSYRYQMMFEVYANLLRAHDQMYDAIKAKAGDRSTKVGIVHQMLEFEAERSWDFGPVVQKYMNWIFMSDAFMHFARTGEFKAYVPGLVDVSYTSERPRGDFIGINYYTKPLIKVGCGNPDHMWAHSEEGEVYTDMNFRTHPEGLYQWLRELHSLGLPLVITENGIADASDDRRGFFIQQQLYAIQQAMKEGVNLGGYFHWSAFDNAEWEHGLGTKRFGLYAVDFETKERSLREGARAYMNAIEIWKEQIESTAEPKKD